MASTRAIQLRSAIAQEEELRASSYDHVSAALWALIIIFGLLASIVVMMWLQMQRKRSAGELSTIVKVEPEELGELKPLGIGDDAEDPGIEEFYEVDIPQLADAVEAVTDAPSQFRSLLANVDGTEVQMGKGRGLGSRDGGGGGRGGGGADRWSIEYESENINRYIDQLMAFGIEIGFVSKVTDRVEIVFDLRDSPKIRPTTKAEERRSYFIHANSRLKSWDMRLGAAAGVKPEGKIMVQFYPPATTKRLAELEAEEANRQQIEIKNIRRTVFKVRPGGSAGFEYYVSEIIPKTPASQQ